MSEKWTRTPWISASGLVNLTEGKDIANDFLKAYPDSKYISYHTDRFSAGRSDTAAEEIRDSLLEIRIFNACAELRLFRTSVGTNFQYRIADDGVLKANVEAFETEDNFLKDPEHYRHETRQILDIDATAEFYRNDERDSHGCLKLRTVGGGTYALPLEGKENVALVIDYLGYDEKTGVCSTMDDRIAGFEKWEGENANG